MFFIIYKTTNLVNGKTYIGKHATTNVDDGYLGSGTLLRRAIIKHGKHSFSKEILFVFSTQLDMDNKERELVDAAFVARSDTYNLKEGGDGGFDFINRTGRAVLISSQEPSPGEYSRRAVARRRELFATDRNWASAYSKKLSIASKRYCLENGGSFKGKRHREESKQLISEKLKGKRTGVNNPQFGTMWITDGSANRKQPADQPIPNGWRRGRVMN